MSLHKTSSNFTKLTNKDRAHLRRSYSNNFHRPIFISRVSSKPSIPVAIQSQTIPKSVSYPKKIIQVEPKPQKSFLIFTPKKYDLYSKKFTDELEASAQLLHPNSTCVDRVKKSFYTDVDLAMSELEQDKTGYGRISFLPTYSHPKSKDFFNAIKINDLEQVTLLLSQHPDLRTSLDSVIPNQTQQNAMHWACRRSGPEIIEALLKAGVDWKHHDIVHRTPQSIAEKYKNTQALAIFSRISNARRRGALNHRALMKLRTKLIRRVSKLNRAL